MRMLLATYFVGIVSPVGLCGPSDCVALRIVWPFGLCGFGIVWHRLCRCVIPVINLCHAYLFD